MSLWSVLVFLISLLDFVLMCLLARDYKACDDIHTNSDCFLVNGIGFTLASRGFLLWLLNVGTAAVILSIGIKVTQNSIGFHKYCSIFIILTLKFTTFRWKFTDNASSMFIFNKWSIYALARVTSILSRFIVLKTFFCYQLLTYQVVEELVSLLQVYWYTGLGLCFQFRCVGSLPFPS